jgi:hypothetical protein
MPMVSFLLAAHQAPQICVKSLKKQWVQCHCIRIVFRNAKLLKQGSADEELCDAAQWKLAHIVSSKTNRSGYNCQVNPNTNFKT